MTGYSFSSQPRYEVSVSIANPAASCQGPGKNLTNRVHTSPGGRPTPVSLNSAPGQGRTLPCGRTLPKQRALLRGCLKGPQPLHVQSAAAACTPRGAIPKESLPVSAPGRAPSPRAAAGGTGRKGAGGGCHPRKCKLAFSRIRTRMRLRTAASRRHEDAYEDREGLPLSISRRAPLPTLP